MSHSTVITVKTFHGQTLEVETGTRQVAEMFNIKALDENGEGTNDKTFANEEARMVLNKIIRESNMGYDNTALLALMLTFTYDDVEKRRTALEKKEQGEDFIKEWDVAYDNVPDALTVTITHFDQSLPQGSLTRAFYND